MEVDAKKDSQTNQNACNLLKQKIELLYDKFGEGVYEEYLVIHNLFTQKFSSEEKEKIFEIYREKYGK